jgi:hypothetical protein
MYIMFIQTMGRWRGFSEEEMKLIKVSETNIELEPEPEW